MPTITCHITPWCFPASGDFTPFKWPIYGVRIAKRMGGLVRKSHRKSWSLPGLLGGPGSRGGKGGPWTSNVLIQFGGEIITWIVDSRGTGQVDFVPSPSPMTSTTLQRLCICRDARKYWMFLGWGGQRIGMSGVPAHNLPFYKGLTSHQMDPNGGCRTGNQAGSDISVSENIKSCYFTLSTSRIRLAFPTNLQACHFISYCTAQLSPPNSG